MCGIVGYNGKVSATEVIFDGLMRLEYRGYDSAGVAVNDGDKLAVAKNAGRVRDLRTSIAGKLPGSSLRLGQIFLEKKYLTVPQFLDIIRLQNKEVAQCPHCQTFFDTHEATPGAPFGCSSCGHVVRSRA